MEGAGFEFLLDIVGLVLSWLGVLLAPLVWACKKVWGFLNPELPDVLTFDDIDNR